jgi:hypothetical protein
MLRNTRHSIVGRNHFRGRKSNFSVTALKKVSRSEVINKFLRKLRELVTKLLSDLFFTDDELEDEEPWDLEYGGSGIDEEALDDEEPLDDEDPLDDEEPSDDEESLDDEELLDDEEPSQDKYIYNSEGESEIDLDNEDDGPTGNTVY